MMSYRGNPIAIRFTFSAALPVPKNVTVKSTRDVVICLIVTLRSDPFSDFEVSTGVAVTTGGYLNSPVLKEYDLSTVNPGDTSVSVEKTSTIPATTLVLVTRVFCVPLVVSMDVYL